MSASLELGNGNWAVKSDALLGYKTINGKYYPREFSVTRATTATRVNPQGFVEVTPYNLLRYSEMFEDASWTKTRASITPDTTIAPNGNLTADSLVENTTTSTHSMSVAITSTGLSYTVSIYAKANQRNWINISWLSTANASAFFNLSTGTLGTVGSSATATITSVGDEWYRCTMTATLAAGANTLAYYLASDNNTLSYTGNGTDGIFVWGAQLVEGTEPLDYLPTTDRLDVARIDYSLGSANLLLEPQRTNLALQSSSFDSATWSKTAVSIAANSTTSPSGIVDADTLAGDGTSSTKGLLQTGAATLTSGVTYTTSIYAKKNTNNFIQLVGSSAPYVTANVFANFDLNSGVVGSVGASSTATITNVGNGWYRCTMTATAAATSNTNAFIVQLVSSSTAARGEINTLSTSVFLWGAQLEAGAYATSYVPTTTASVTRNADSISRSNIYTNGLITDAGGTWFVELRNNVPLIRDSLQSELYIGEDANLATAPSKQSIAIRNASSSAARLSINYWNGSTFTYQFTTTTDTCKIAIKFTATSFDVFVNGVKVANAQPISWTLANVQNLNGLVGVRRFINSMALYPTPLSDTECINLTTL